MDTLLRNRLHLEDAELRVESSASGSIILWAKPASELGSTPYTEPKGFLLLARTWSATPFCGSGVVVRQAAVAAGLRAVARESDGGGSPAYSAACCGLAGPNQREEGRLRLHSKIRAGLVAKGIFWHNVLLRMLPRYYHHGSGRYSRRSRWPPFAQKHFSPLRSSLSISLQIRFVTAIAPGWAVLIHLANRQC